MTDAITDALTTLNDPNATPEEGVVALADALLPLVKDAQFLMVVVGRQEPESQRAAFRMGVTGGLPDDLELDTLLRMLARAYEDNERLEKQHISGKAH